MVFHPRRKQNGSCFTDPLHAPLDSPRCAFGHFHSFNISNMRFHVNSSQEEFTVRSKNRLVRKKTVGLESRRFFRYGVWLRRTVPKDSGWRYHTPSMHSTRKVSSFSKESKEPSKYTFTVISRKSVMDSKGMV